VIWRTVRKYLADEAPSAPPSNPPQAGTQPRLIGGGGGGDQRVQPFDSGVAAASGLLSVAIGLATVSSTSSHTIRSAPARMGACPAGRGRNREDTQRRRRPDAAEQPAHAARRSRSMSLIESAPRPCQPPAPAPSTLDWRPRLRHPHMARGQPGQPSSSRQATSGANAAHDTKFGRDPSTFPTSRKRRKIVQ
jgi:hypothetical protein